MNDPRRIRVTLPGDVALMLQERMASGAYADPADAIRDGLMALRLTNVDRENWLRGPVAESYDEYQANPEGTIPAEKMLARTIAAYDRYRVRDER